MSEQNRLPKGWVESTLGTIHRDDSEGIVPMKYPEQQFELFSVPSHATGRAELVKGAEIGSNKQTVTPNTVLLCKINPRINRVWIVSKNNQRPQIASTEWIPFSPVDGILAGYLAYYLQQHHFRAFLAGSASGVGGSLMRVKASTLRHYPFLFAPTNEQRRIVAKIEELFSDLDAGVAALVRIRANLKRYRAAVLKAAVEGRLTEAWRAKHVDAASRRVGDAEETRQDAASTYEPATKLLERILAERRKKWQEDQLARFAAADKTPPKGWREKYVEPAGPDTIGLPELPQGWCWASVEQTSEVQGGIQKQPKRAPKEHAFPFLRVANVHRSRLELDDIHKIELFGDELERLRLQPDDLLVVEGNGSKTEIGRSAIWNGGLENCVHQNHIIRVRFLAGSSRYLNAYWNSPSGNGRVMDQAASTSGLYTLSVTKVCALPIPLAPFTEQQEIVTEVEERLSVIAASEQQIEANLKRAARLRQSILKRAFEGKLVPQDPTDEPADKLLDRIRQERESSNIQEGKNGSARRRTSGTAKASTKVKK